jgi:hypothetical protein
MAVTLMSGVIVTMVSIFDSTLSRKCVPAARQFAVLWPAMKAIFQGVFA